MSIDGYPGVKAIFKDTNAVDPDIIFDVGTWHGTRGTVVGLIVIPNSSKLVHPVHAPVPANYVFSGYAYCP
jgi:hypothetical protein